MPRKILGTEKEHHFIYALLDPETKEVRYIGRTSCGMARICQHRNPNSYKYKNNYLACWLKNLQSRGLKPDYEILQECKTAEETYEAEPTYIELYRSLGARLTNHAAGGYNGNLGYNPSKEVRSKTSARMKVLWNDPEHRAARIEKMTKAQRNIDRSAIQKKCYKENPVVKKCLDKGRKIIAEKRRREATKIVAVPYKDKKLPRLYFDTIYDMKAYGFSPGTTYAVLKGNQGRKQHKGYKFYEWRQTCGS